MCVLLVVFSLALSTLAQGQAGKRRAPCLVVGAGARGAGGCLCSPGAAFAAPCFVPGTVLGP